MQGEGEGMRFEYEEIKKAVADLPAMLTVDEVARFLRVSYKTVFRLIAYGKMRAVKVGRQWRVPKECLREFLNEFHSFNRD